MRKQLQEEFDHLNQIILKMADSVQYNILESVNAYLNKDKNIIINDDIIDQYERLVEEICLDILIKERLYARDLREVTGILKLVGDLERIGDHAEDIMVFNKRLEGINLPRPKVVDEMLNLTLEMIKNVIISFVKRDTDMARDIIEQDDVIDDLYEKALNTLADRESVNQEELSFAIYTTLVVKYIERVADHAVNIAEWVIYIVFGYHKDKQIF